MNDRELGEDGIRRDPRMTETAITRLYEAAAEVTDDLGKQSEIVALCVVAHVDSNELRRRSGVGRVEPDRPVPDVRPVVSHKPNRHSGRVPSHNPNGLHNR